MPSDRFGVQFLKRYPVKDATFQVSIFSYSLANLNF